MVMVYTNEHLLMQLQFPSVNFIIYISLQSHTIRQINALAADIQVTTGSEIFSAFKLPVFTGFIAFSQVPSGEALYYYMFRINACKVLTHLP